MSSDLPYITENLAGVGGTLRSTANHFIVDEVPLYEPSNDGQHLYVNLTKVGMTTKEVQRSMAKLFGVASGSIGFAGLKDKHARTTQTFSLPLGHIGDAEVDAAVQRIEAEIPITINWARLHGNKLKAGHLLGNCFSIAIGNLDRSAQDLLPQASAIVDHIRDYGIPNYFGPQRFGLDGANVEKGYEILVGKKWIKDRWLRRFLISSYQSHLCNLYLSRRVSGGNFHCLLLGDVAKKHETGGIFEVEDLTVEERRYQAKEISFTAPMFGPKMRATSGPAGELESAILAESGVTIDQLRRAKIDGTRRLGRLLVPDISVKASMNIDDHAHDFGPVAENGLLWIEFFLPKGAFATTVLREVMKVNLFTSIDIE